MEEIIPTSEGSCMYCETCARIYGFYKVYGSSANIKSKTCIEYYDLQKL